jgi:hypothetical protein
LFATFIISSGTGAPITTIILFPVWLVLTGILYLSTKNKQGIMKHTKNFGTLILVWGLISMALIFSIVLGGSIIFVEIAISIVAIIMGIWFFYVGTKERYNGK